MNKDVYMKFGVWLVALVCVTILVAMGKAKPEMLEVIMSYLAGVVVKTIGSASLNVSERNLGSQSVQEEKSDGNS